MCMYICVYQQNLLKIIANILKKNIVKLSYILKLGYCFIEHVVAYFGSLRPI